MFEIKFHSLTYNQTFNYLKLQVFEVRFTTGFVLRSAYNIASGQSIEKKLRRIIHFEQCVELPKQINFPTR